MSEIVDVYAVRCDHRRSPHIVKRILAEDPPPTRASRRFPALYDSADPAARRLAIIQLHSEGQAVKSIVGYRQTGKRTVYHSLRRWFPGAWRLRRPVARARTGRGR